MKISQPHSMVCVLEKEMSASEELHFFLGSDLHFDHPKCNRELLKEHLDECVAKGGYIMLNGDIFCIMQGKYDKRHSKGSIRPEHMVDSYFDAVVDDAVEFFLPYAKQIVFIGMGNHETSVIKRMETDIIRRFIERIYLQTGHRIAQGQYHGWVYIKVLDKKTMANGNRRQVKTLSYKIYHNHGAGGDAAVTKGAIEDERKMTQVETADAIWMGHNHHKYVRPVAVHYLDTNPQSMQPKIRIVENIRTGTYKQEYTGHGWHIETGKAPKPLGGIWLTLKYVRTHKKVFLSAHLTPTWTDEIIIEG